MRRQGMPLRQDSQTGHWVAATARCTPLRGMTLLLRRPNAWCTGAHVAGARLPLRPGRLHFPKTWYHADLASACANEQRTQFQTKGVGAWGVGSATACLAAVLYEMCSLDRRLGEEHAVVADDPHGVAVDVRKPTHERGACAAER